MFFRLVYRFLRRSREPRMRSRLSLLSAAGEEEASGRTILVPEPFPVCVEAYRVRKTDERLQSMVRYIDERSSHGAYVYYLSYVYHLL